MLLRWSDLNSVLGPLRALKTPLPYVSPLPYVFCIKCILFARGFLLTHNAVLVLNKLYPDQVPLLVSAQGLVDDDLEFTFGENTEVYFACSTTLNGEFYLFGGDHIDTQVRTLRISYKLLPKRYLRIP